MRAAIWYEIFATNLHEIRILTNKNPIFLKSGLELNLINK